MNDIFEDLRKIVAAKVGIANAASITITSVTTGTDGKYCVHGLALTVDSEQLNFSIPCMTIASEPAQMLYPFGADFQPPLPEVPEIGDAEEAWRWSEGRMPLIAQPLYSGFTGIIEKLGGKANLWLAGDRGVDHLSKFIDVKKFTIDLPEDFVAEVQVGLVRDGAYLPSEEQERLWKSEQLPDDTSIAISLADLLHLNGSDLHELDAAGRIEKMRDFYGKSLVGEPAFRLLPMQRAEDQSQLEKALIWGREFQDSTGVALKAAGSVYSMLGKSPDIARVAKSDPLSVGIYKALGSEQIAIGVILRPDFEDAQEDVMTPEDVRAAAHYFMENHRVIKFRHGKDPAYGDKAIDAVVLESYVAPADFKLGSGQVKAGDWVMAVRIDDQGIWERIESGELKGFSVGGRGTRQELQ